MDSLGEFLSSTATATLNDLTQLVSAANGSATIGAMDNELDADTSAIVDVTKLAKVDVVSNGITVRQTTNGRMSDRDMILIITLCGGLLVVVVMVLAVLVVLRFKKVKRLKNNNANQQQELRKVKDESYDNQIYTMMGENVNSAPTTSNTATTTANNNLTAESTNNGDTATTTTGPGDAEQQPNTKDYFNIQVEEEDQDQEDEDEEEFNRSVRF